MRSVPIYLVLLLQLVLGIEAKEYHVSLQGDDLHPGTPAQPFRTIQHAADVMQPGDICLVHGGTYRETVTPPRSGKEGEPIRFAAAPGEAVILDGTELVTGKWRSFKGRILNTKVDEPIEQLFVDRQMMFEARWPNMRFDQRYDRSCWAQANMGSRYGKMADPELAKTDIDWTGALATMNLAHQFYSWTRTVTHHKKGGETFTYEKNLSGITHFADKTKPWEDDYYYLSGKFEALDVPTEWFYDSNQGMLFLYPEGGQALRNQEVAYKKRTYAFDLTGKNHIQISGFEFFATTFRLNQCDHCVVEHCRLKFPTFSRRITEFDTPSMKSPHTSVSGNNNIIRHTGIAYASGQGLTVSGERNIIENCIIHDVCWNGSLSYGALNVYGGRDPSAGCTVRSNTLYNAGNAILNYRKGAHTIEYNHVYNGGLLCKDVALVYTGQPSAAGSVVRYNWVHGCRAQAGTGRAGHGGLGIRGDDQTRSLTVHHNVVWDCGRDGIIVKGDHNRVYNNTVFDIGSEDWIGNHISLHTVAEPEKYWRQQHPLLPEQNVHSKIFNNAAHVISSNARGRPFPEDARSSNNFHGQELKLMNPAQLDFRPKPDSPLVDAGKVISGFTDGFAGPAPDIGAYEYKGRYWKAGADWLFE